MRYCRFGFAAGCEAWASPRRWLDRQSLGSALGAGYALHKTGGPNAAPGAQPRISRGPVAAGQSPRLTSGGKAVTTTFVTFAAKATIFKPLDTPILTTPKRNG